MFTIRCETCAAKLKVTQPTAIDQKLACPKCGNMIHVQPPSDWVPPPGWESPPGWQSSTADSSLSSAGATSFSDFDDIDHLLDQSQSGNVGHRAPAADPSTSVKKAGSAPGSLKPTGGQPSPDNAVGKVKTSPPAGPNPKPNASGLPNTSGSPTARTKPAAGIQPGVKTAPGSKSGDGGAPEGGVNSAKAKTSGAKADHPKLQPSGSRSPAVNASHSKSGVSIEVNRNDTNRSDVNRNTLHPAIGGVSNTVRRRQQMLLIGFLAGLGVIGLTVVIWLIVSSGNRRQVANNGTPSQQDSTPQTPAEDDPTKSDPKGDSTKPSTSSNSDDSQDATGTPVNPNENAQPLIDPPSNGEGTNTVDPVPPVINEGPPKVNLTGDPPILPVSPLGTTANPSTEETLKTDDKPPSLANALNPLGQPNQDLSVAPKLFGEQSVNDALGDLSVLLANTSETSLNELAEVAAGERRVTTAGLSPLFVPKPDPPKIVGTLTDRLAIGIKEVQYIQSPMAVEINQLARLVGYPITFDLIHIDTEQTDLFQPMTWDAADLTLEQVLERMFVNAGLSKHWTSSGEAAVGSDSPGLAATGMIVRPVGFDQTSTQLYDIPAMAQRSAEQRLELIEQAKLFLVPFSWEQAGGSASLRESGDQWEILQIPLGHRTVSRWLARLQAALQLSQQENVDAATEVLKTKTAQAEPYLSRPLNWSAHWQRSLDEVLEQLRRDTGLRVLVDWDSIAYQGWNPQVRVPGIIRSRTAREFLDQLTQSMELAWRIVDSQTVEITTHERLRARVDLEVYSLADLARTGLTPERIRDLLNAVLGVQAGRAGAIWYYDAPTQSLWILAPQWLQQQVEPILDRLRNKPAQ